jgi:hypothetical protein
MSSLIDSGNWEALLLSGPPVLGDEGGITPRTGSGGGGEEGTRRLPARQRGQTYADHNLSCVPDPDLWIHTAGLRIRTLFFFSQVLKNLEHLREAQKHTDPTDADPEHWSLRRHKTVEISTVYF